MSAAFAYPNGLPVSQDAERSLLGGVMLDPDHIVALRSQIAAGDFALEQHRQIFRAMVALDDKQIPADMVTLRQQLMETKRLESVGGIAYLASLTEGMPRYASLDRYVEIIREKAALRSLAEMAQNVAAKVADGTFPSHDVIDAVQADLERIVDGSEDMLEPIIGRTIVSTFDALCKARHEDTRHDGVSFGLASLDDYTAGGMRNGEVTIVGARSGVGKSSLMCQTAVANARAGVPVHLFSLEMTRLQLEHRILAIESGVPFRHIDRSIFDDHEEARMFSATQRIADWPLRIHDKSEMHISQIVGLAKLSIRRFGTRLVVVDYAQNVNADGKDERTRVGSVSQKLTNMIKHEPAALMLLSQLRKVEKKEYSKPPIILDLLETGKLEQNAHLVLLLHRGYDEEQARISDDAEIIVAKQRRGDTGPLGFRFSRKSVTFVER